MVKDTVSSDDVKGLITAWLDASKTEQSDYLTKEGLAYMNGFLQANNTMALIKIEKYNQLLQDYEELLHKYTKLKNLDLMTLRDELLKTNESLKAKDKRLEKANNRIKELKNQKSLITFIKGIIHK